MDRLLLNDEQRSAIEPLLPGKTTDCGVTAKNNRLRTKGICVEQISPFL